MKEVEQRKVHLGAQMKQLLLGSAAIFKVTMSVLLVLKDT